MKDIELLVLEYLKENCKGKANAQNGSKIAFEFGMTSIQLRKVIKGIKDKQDIIIGADIKDGYYIPLRSEYKDALKYRQNKCLSELKGNIKDDPSFILKVFKTLNIKRTSNSQGQLMFDIDNVDLDNLEKVDFFDVE